MSLLSLAVSLMIVALRFPRISSSGITVTDGTVNSVVTVSSVQELGMKILVLTPCSLIRSSASDFVHYKRDPVLTKQFTLILSFFITFSVALATKWLIKSLLSLTVILPSRLSIFSSSISQVSSKLPNMQRMDLLKPVSIA